jgi:hypothetical protein
MGGVDAKLCKFSFQGGEVRDVALAHNRLWSFVGLLLVRSGRAVLAGSSGGLEARVVAD